MRPFPDRTEGTRIPPGSSVKATHVSFDEDNMRVEPTDCRTLGVPLAWFPRLLHGTAEQREQVRISSRGLHWEALEEDLLVAGPLAGLGDQTATEKPPPHRLSPGVERRREESALTRRPIVQVEQRLPLSARPQRRIGKDRRKTGAEKLCRPTVRSHPKPLSSPRPQS